MSQGNDTAEQRFRAAFDRLKANSPVRLEKGAPVSQNNVAKEAGVSATSLRKTRYPSLIRDIQDWIKNRDADRVADQKRKRVRDEQHLNSQALLAQLRVERDWAQSQLISSHRQILELLEENAQLQVRLDELLPPPVPLRR